MKLWPFVIALLAFQPPICTGQTAPSPPAAGDEALASGLWELAISRYKERLATPALKPDEKAALMVKIAEAWVRSGHPAEALTLLNQPSSEKQPDAPFWKAQALAGLERQEEAAAIFKTILANPAAPHCTEAALTLANLQLALKQPDAALETLNGLIASEDPEISIHAKLRKVEFLLDLNRDAEARTTMPEPREIPAGNQPLADFLTAQLLISEGKTAEAAAAFSTILSKPAGQSLAHYHSAALGLADAINAQGDREAAADSLLGFLQNHPETPLLEGIFARLLQWLPEKPTLAEPILQRLSQWIAPTPQAAMGLISMQGDAAITAWPIAKETNLLSAFSTFTRAVALYRIGTPDTQSEARILMTRLRMESLPQFLSNRVALQTGRWLLEEGKMDQADLILDTLRNNRKNAAASGEAAFIEAKAAFAAGDPKRAMLLFDEAAANLDEPSAQVARINARFAQLAETAKDQSPPGTNDSMPVDQQLQTEVQLEQALSQPQPDVARKLIEQFILQHPQHPRLPEARLYAAESALASTPPDIAFATTQLENLASQPEMLAKLPADRMALARLRLADLSKNQELAITTARAIITRYPGQPIAAEAAFTLGRTLFQSGNLNEARLVLEKLAATDPDPARVQAALIIAARAAALGGTPKSREEALALFDKAITSNGPMTTIAVLEKARLMIDVIELNRLPEAVKFLRKWFQSLKEDDPLRLPTGLLLGEAIYTQGSSDPKSLDEALTIYNQLLSHAKDQPALLYRLQYLRGMTLERLPEKENPTVMRDAEALAVYYSVLEGASSTNPPAEWEYFERCGFRAFEMLKNEKRWKAAIEVAEKIASFNGPKAHEAEAAAQAIRLKYMIWED